METGEMYFFDNGFKFSTESTGLGIKDEESMFSGLQTSNILSLFCLDPIRSCIKMEMER